MLPKWTARKCTGGLLPRGHLITQNPKKAAAKDTLPVGSEASNYQESSTRSRGTFASDIQLNTTSETMPRTKRTARKCTGGKAPRRRLATKPTKKRSSDSGPGGNAASNYQVSSPGSLRSLSIASDIQVKMEDEQNEEEEELVMLSDASGQHSSNEIGTKLANLKSAYDHLQNARRLLTETGVIASSMEGNANLNGLELVVMDAIKKAEANQKVTSSSYVQNRVQSSATRGKGGSGFGIQVRSVARKSIVD